MESAYYNRNAILLLDDEFDIMTLFTKALKEQGFLELLWLYQIVRIHGARRRKLASIGTPVELCKRHTGLTGRN